MIIFVGIVSLLLALTAGAGALNLPAIASTFVAAVLASYVISLFAGLTEKDSIATFRRATALVFVGGVVWLFCLGCGLAYSSIVGNSHPLAGALIFGGFSCGGAEFVVINGVFTKRIGFSLLLAALHPVLTAAFFVFLGVVGSFSPLAPVLGAINAIILIFFIVMLRYHQTPDRKYDSVGLFRAFMKTWVGGKATELEGIIAARARKVKASTRIMRFQCTGGDIFIVLPGVHPGPFYPVGSYNLPGLMFEKFSKDASILTLHRPGGHERNLATTEDTSRFVSDVYDRALSIQTGSVAAEIHGPVVSRVGMATVTSFAMAHDALLTISFAPLGSEDLETPVEDELSNLGAAFGFDVSVVDAHNSIEPKRQTVDTGDPGWKDIFGRLKDSKAAPFKVGYANSHELGLGSTHDITAGGIGLMLLESEGRKWALVLVDSNNAIPSLREAVSASLKPMGYDLFEFCTTDSHDLAARGLTVNRGYHALGEATTTDEISKTVVELAKMAGSRLAVCRYGSETLVSEVNTFGVGSLDEFDAVAKSSINFAKHYAMFATAATILLLVSSLVV